MDGGVGVQRRLKDSMSSNERFRCDIRKAPIVAP